MANGIRSSQIRVDRVAGQSGWALFRKLLYFGLGVKRWLLAGAVGIGVCAVGIAFVIKNLFALNAPNVLPWHFEGVILAATGVALILVSVWGLYRSVGPLLLRYQSVSKLARTVYDRRSRERGPRVVTIGGGTGLSVLLRGLKSHTDNITAIVTVADDGGSSGRLRRELGVPPPGDFRNCLVALSEDEGLVAELFQYRFNQAGSLEGHSFGNLFIAAMASVTGSFEQALHESSKVLAVHGRILPATRSHLHLAARLTDGTVVRGESKIAESGGSIEQIMIEPTNSTAHPDAVDAIMRADVVVIGPGSLFTSLLPNLLVSEIADALRVSNAMTIYVCNVATEKGETEGFSAADHVRTLQEHTFPTIADYVVTNENVVKLGPEFGGEPVAAVDESPPNVRVVSEDLIDASDPVRHDSTKLAQVVLDVYHGREPASARQGVAAGR